MSEVVTYYLEMTSASSLSAKTLPAELRIRECKVKSFEFNRSMYQRVGEDWDWTDRLSWTDREWKAYAESDDLRTWGASFEGSAAGYFELQQQEGAAVQITSLGLAPRFIGRGLGGCLLHHAITSAWEWPGTTRVWLHTCSLDHPNALQNYKARGMRLYHTEKKELRPST